MIHNEIENAWDGVDIRARKLFDNMSRMSRGSMSEQDHVIHSFSAS